MKIDRVKLSEESARLSLVHTSNANANANARNEKNFTCLHLLAIAFSTCEQGETKVMQAACLCICIAREN